MNIKKIGLILRNYVDKVVLLVLLMLLIGMYLFYLNEQNTEVEEIDIQKETIIDPQIDPEVLEKVQEFLHQNSDIDNNPDYKELLRQNPFEYKHPRDREAIIADADRNYQIALDLYNRGSLQEALNACEKTLQIYSGHSKAKKLKKTLDTQLEEKEKEEAPTGNESE